MKLKKIISGLCLATTALAPFTFANVLETPQQCFCTDHAQLHHLFDSFFEESQRTYPELATYLGNKQYNSYWTDYSLEGYALRNATVAAYLEKLQDIDYEQLSDDDKLNYNLFKRSLQDSLQENALHLHYMPLDQLGGIPLDVTQIFEMMPLESVTDVENILARLIGIPKLLAQTKKLLELGLAEGLTPPQICLQSLPQRLHNLIRYEIEASPFYLPFLNLPENISGVEKEALQQNAKTLIAKCVNPAYEELLAYVTDEYIPQCRTTIGMTDCPNGEAIYNYLVKLHTTTNYEASTIHELGLTEVERISQEMHKLLDQQGYNGTYAGFLHFLHSEPSFFYSAPKDLLAGYRSIMSTIDQHLPLLFNKQPTLPFEIVPVPAHSEQNQVAAYYMAGSLNSGRPGRFFVNTYDLQSRPKWQMETLALHEAIPGHHFQISLSQELEQPEFRKHARCTAYVEGWALYTEGLGQDLGLYLDPYTRFGRHVEEIWRAVRLVVDTGMHAKGWSREQAIEYFMRHTGSGRREASVEIDRYLVWPGQALAYKMGEFAILTWRSIASDILGDEFDIREFHDVVLSQGALPLDMFAERMHEWIVKKKWHKI